MHAGRHEKYLLVELIPDPKKAEAVFPNLIWCCNNLQVLQITVSNRKKASYDLHAYIIS
jgi:hypothetical protein